MNSLPKLGFGLFNFLPTHIFKGVFARAKEGHCKAVVSSLHVAGHVAPPVCLASITFSLVQVGLQPDAEHPGAAIVGVAHGGSAGLLASLLPGLFSCFLRSGYRRGEEPSSYLKIEGDKEK